MGKTISTDELYKEIAEQRVPFILDVRNQEEYAAWVVEGTKPVEMKNVPIWLAVEQIEDLAKDLPDDTVVICAHGNGSDLLLDLLQDEGKTCRNLEGGTAAWAELLVPKKLDCLPENMVGWQIQRPAKACLSYVIGVPGGNAIVVDPARFTEPYVELAATEGMTITHVIDTHVHADHISGGAELAQRLGVPYHVPADDAGRKNPLAKDSFGDFSEIDLGDAKVELLAIKMPGHTPGSTCIHIPGHLILTGDTVFVRGIGRPDLTGKASELASELFHTIHDRLEPLDPQTKVLPGHWSFLSEFDENDLVMTNLGHVFESSLLNEKDLEKFIQEVIDTLPSAPETYDRIRRVNSGEIANADEIEFLEIGKNQCAASTTT